MCLRQVGLERRQLDVARRRLVALGAGDPQQPWATLVLAHLTLDELRRDAAIACTNGRRRRLRSGATPMAR